FTLQRGNGLHRMRPPNSLRSRFGESEALHLAFADEVLHSAGYIFDGNFGIDAVLVKQVDHIGTKALQRSLGGLFDMRRAAVQIGPTERAVGARPEAELGCDHHLVTHWGEGFADEFLIRERAVNFRGIEEGNAALDSRADES